MFAGGNLWSHFVVRIFRFAASFPVEWAFFFLLCACAWNMYSRKFFPTRMECSLSIRQQKHKRKEISFCSSNVWEKHLEESGKEGDTEGREHKEDKGCVRGDLSVLGFMGFFWGGFSQSVSFARPAEMDHRCAQSAELNFKVNGYLSDGHWRTFFVKKKTINVMCWCLLRFCLGDTLTLGMKGSLCARVCV